MQQERLVAVKNAVADAGAHTMGFAWFHINDQGQASMISDVELAALCLIHGMLSAEINRRFTLNQQQAPMPPAKLEPV